MAERRRALPGIDVPIPGRRKPLRIERVVFDFNGTLAVEGTLVRGIGARLKELAKQVDVVVMTADTFGTARRALVGVPVTIRVVRTGAEKRRYVESVGSGTVAAVGNGLNDVPMLRAAVLGIAVLGGEGLSGELARAAAVLVRDVNDAVDLFLEPRRLVATLRR